MEKPISTLCHCWGVRADKKLRSHRQRTKERGQQESDTPPLAQISEAGAGGGHCDLSAGRTQVRTESGGGGVQETGQIRDW